MIKIINPFKTYQNFSDQNLDKYVQIYASFAVRAPDVLLRLPLLVYPLLTDRTLSTCTICPFYIK